MGMSGGRRDEIESMCYTLVEMGKGALPWSYVKTSLDI